MKRIVLVAVMAAAVSVTGATKTWYGGNGDWAASGWGGSEPDAGDDVVINSGTVTL